ncbi:MAG: zinc-dependent peptidase, partial [Chitinophagaceae bacterium]|nr:zinc-dependent peptidase [Chitinophagaceae bacterium]
MAIVLQTLFILLGLIILILLAFKMKSEKAENVLPENYWDILEEYVRFYRALPEADKKLFEKRVEKFLKEVKITGVNAEVEELDMMLIAAAAIIPVFAIPDWEY